LKSNFIGNQSKQQSARLGAWQERVRASVRALTEKAFPKFSMLRIA
jgi:hypothetical protein